MRKNIDGLAIILMVMICGVWGCQQVAIKSVAQQISPGLQVGIRSAVAALFVHLLFNRKDRIFHRLKNRRVLIPGLAVGILFALEFLLVVTGIRLTSTSHTTLFLYTTPLFTAGVYFLGETLYHDFVIGSLLILTVLVVCRLGRRKLPLPLFTSIQRR
jgi:drug/metabolite transporter (DMT)-like permease